MKNHISELFSKKELSDIPPQFMVRRTLVEMPEGLGAAVVMNEYGAAGDPLIAHCTQLMLPNKNVRVPFLSRAKKKDQILIDKVSQKWHCNSRRAEQIISIKGEKRLKQMFGIK